MSTEFYLIAAAIVTVLSAARLTRLSVVDDFPPIVFFRDKIYNRLEGSGWQAITWCGYCFSFWATAPVVGWGALAHVYGHPPNHLTGWAIVWWLLFGTLAASYLAVFFVAHDGDDS